MSISLTVAAALSIDTGRFPESAQVGPGEVDDELEEEIAGECAKYGQVLKVSLLFVPFVCVLAWKESRKCAVLVCGLGIPGQKPDGPFFVWLLVLQAMSFNR